jgi:MoaA/NifB/PqqE/SkfB family radical SAM enzyme
MISYEDIQQIHLELTTLCNAKCPQCPRNFNGFTFNDGYPETYMTLDQAKHIFNPAFLKQLTQFTINGNYGDMVMNPDTVGIVEYFREINPDVEIIISTNGGARNKEFWQRLAKANTQVCFDLDGIDEVHSLYRQNTIYQTVIKNALIYIGAGGHAIWKCIKFKHNIHQIEEMRQLAVDFGFKSFELIDHGRDTGPVFNDKKELTHVLGDYTGTTDFETMFNDQRSESRTVDNTAWKFDPAVDDIEITCDTLTNNRIYVAANGEVSPCCFTGLYPETFGKNSYVEPLNTQLNTLISKNNALDYDIQTCIEWFKDFKRLWEVKDYKTGRLLVCDEYCGKCKSV